MTMNDAELRAEIARIAHELRTQGNDYTRDPVFVVQRRRRIYGIDLDYTDAMVILDADGTEVEAPDGIDADALEAQGLVLTGYKDEWESVQWFLTRAAAEAYGHAQAHNLGEWQVYTDSAHRNREVQALRQFVAKLTPAVLESWP